MRNWISQTRADRPILFWSVLGMIVLPALVALYETVLIGGFWLFWRATGGMSEATVDAIAYTLLCVGAVLGLVTALLLGRARGAEQPQLPAGYRISQPQNYRETPVG